MSGCFWSPLTSTAPQRKPFARFAFYCISYRCGRGCLMIGRIFVQTSSRLLGLQKVYVDLLRYWPYAVFDCLLTISFQDLQLAIATKLLDGPDIDDTDTNALYKKCLTKLSSVALPPPSLPRAVASLYYPDARCTCPPRTCPPC